MNQTLPLPWEVPLIDFDQVPKKPRAQYGTAEWDRIGYLNDLAARVVLRLYGPEWPTPHGFYQLREFITTARARDARNRIRKCLILRLWARDIQRGRLQLRK